MGELLNRIKLSNNINGGNIADNFKNNSLFFYEAYSKSSKEILNIPRGKIQMGGFYHFTYLDDSNWMKYSPVFTVDVKKFSNLIIINAVNFNFIPLEIRATLFDKFMTKDNFDDDKLLEVDYKGVYSELIKLGFEYSIVEYNLAQVQTVHKISMDLVPRFLYAQHPINKYDPNKLYSIWNAKIDDKADRNREMSNALIKDFYAASDDITESYTLLKDHINRIQKSLNKYG